MALHEEAVVQHSGQNKELDEGAIDMILDNLQISQYVFPVKSTIRELGSNAVDSIREKNTAIEILTGKAKVEDYYYVPGKNKEMDEAIKANPGVYKDSVFDPLYYNLDYLSSNDRVEIIYKQNGNKAKDTLTVRDHGVGLGDYRLYGYLKIGYSTKRLSKKPLGKWGLGAKAPLSMGVPYYEMISVHNGRKFKMLVYSRHWESIVPETNELGIPNDYINFYNKDGSVLLDEAGNERKVYFEWTDEKNYMESTVNCKKHYITDIRNAVQSQLLYFSNVDFRIINEANEVEEVPVQAPILFEDEALIISDNNQFSKPHIVINNVSYGYINFEELELEQNHGNIGVKVASGEIDVTPNRENVIWNDLTREVVLKRFKQASKAAKKIIMESFQQEDFMEWLGACAGVFGWGNSLNASTPGIKALIQLQNIAKIKGGTHPTFAPDPRIKYSGYIPDMFPGLKVRLVKKETIKRKSGSVEEIVRWDTNSVADLFKYPVYMQGINSSAKRDEYLLSLYPEGFVVIRDPYMPDIVLADITETSVKELPSGNNIGVPTEEADFIEELKKGAHTVGNDSKVTIPLLVSGYPRYEDVEVVELDEAQKLKAQETAEQIRRREQRIVVQTPRDQGPHNSPIWHKVQPKLELLDKLDKEFYWGNNEDKDGILLAAQITNPDKGCSKARSTELSTQAGKLSDYWTKMGIAGNQYGWYTPSLYHWADPEASILLGVIAKENNRYVQEEHFHISEFYNRIEGSVITMARSLIEWNTGRLIKQLLDPIGFLQGMERFDLARYNTYKELQAFVSENYHWIKGNGTLEAVVIQHLDKVGQLQDVVRTTRSDDNIYIAATVQELFGDNASGIITDGLAFIPEYIDKARELSEWAKPVSAMLMMVGKLSNQYEKWTLEQEEAVKEYIDWRTS